MSFVSSSNVSVPTRTAEQLLRVMLLLSRTLVSFVLRCLAQLLLSVAKLLDTNNNNNVNVGSTTDTLDSNNINNHTEDATEKKLYSTIEKTSMAAAVATEELLLAAADDCQQLQKQQLLRARCDSLDSGIGEDLLVVLQQDIDDLEATEAAAVDADTGLPLVTLDEVADHCVASDAWTVVYDRVYDVTEYIGLHPGGEDVLLEYVGHDATNAFRSVGHSRAAFKALNKYCIGILPPAQRLNYEPEY